MARNLGLGVLAKARWREEHPAHRRKTDPGKLQMAGRLRQETPMTLKWIAARLQIGTWKNLNRRLSEYRESKEKWKCAFARNCYLYLRSWFYVRL